MGSALQAAKLGLRTACTQFPLYLITAYPCVLEHGQITQMQLTGEFSVGNSMANIQAEHLQHPTFLQNDPILNETLGLNKSTWQNAASQWEEKNIMCLLLGKCLAFSCALCLLFSGR